MLTDVLGASRLAMTLRFALTFAPCGKYGLRQKLPRLWLPLLSRDTEAVAADWGVTLRQLRGLMMRSGVRIRHIRKAVPAQHAPAAGYWHADRRTGQQQPSAPRHWPSCRTCGCRWPIGDPAGRGLRYCGAARFSVLSPYCAEHHARAYRPAPPIWPLAYASPAPRGRPKAEAASNHNARGRGPTRRHARFLSSKRQRLKFLQAAFDVFRINRAAVFQIIL